LLATTAIAVFYSALTLPPKSSLAAVFRTLPTIRGLFTGILPTHFVLLFMVRLFIAIMHKSRSCHQLLRLAQAQTTQPAFYQNVNNCMEYQFVVLAQVGPRGWAPQKRAAAVELLGY
jgi:hypothetical protein